MRTARLARLGLLLPVLAVAAVLLAAGAVPAAAQGTIPIGDLPPGESVRVYFAAQISPAIAVPAVSNQDTVTGDGGLSQVTDDPATGAADDATVTPVQLPVDLAVSKTESADPVVAGSGAGNLTHQVTVTNNGPGAASNVTLSEAITLPAGVTIDSITASAGTTYAPPNDPSGTWTVGTLANGASATLTVVLTVGPSAAAGTDVVSNTAAVSTVDEDDSNPANDGATVATSVAREIDLAVSKTESADPVVAGSGAGNLTYQVTVVNNGPSDASGVTLAEDLTLPAGVTVDSVTPSAGSFAVTTAPDGTWTVGDLASGDSETLTVVLTVDATTDPGADVISNTATVTGSNETRINTGDDAASESTSVETEADLSIDKIDDVDPAPAGGTLEYTITVTNPGPSDARDVVVTDTLPAEVSSPSTTGCAEDPAGVPTCTLGTIAAGDSKQYTIEVTIDPLATGTITNDAGVATSTPDPNGANDDTSEDTALTPAVFDFGDAPDPFAATPGEYPTLLANDGARHAVGALFLGAEIDDEADGQPSAGADGDDLDAAPDDEDGVTFTSTIVAGDLANTVDVVASGAGQLDAWMDFNADGDWADAGEQIFTNQALAAGTNAGLTFAAPADALEGPTFARFRFSSGGGLAPTGVAPDGEVEDYAVTVERSADLSVTIAPSEDPTAAHRVLLWELVVENDGPSDASGVTLEQELAAGSYFLGTVPAVGFGIPCTLSSGVALSCDVGDLASGDSQTVTVGVFIDGRFDGTQTSEAMASGNEADPDPMNNEDEASAGVRRARSILATTDGGGAPRTVSVLGEFDETIGLVAREADGSGAPDFAVAGPGYRTVALAEVPDFGDTPAPEVAALGFGFDGSTRVFVFDAESMALLSELPVPGGPWVPIDLVSLPSFDGSPAPEIVVGANSLADGKFHLLSLDAASGALLRDAPDPLDLGFLVGVDKLPSFPGAPQILAASADDGFSFQQAIDPDTGAGIAAFFFDNVFPLDVAAADIGGSATEEGIVLIRDILTGDLAACPADYDPPFLLPLVFFDPALEPADLQTVPDFADAPAPELAVLARKGTDVVIEVIDADSGVGVGTTTGSSPPKIPMPLGLAVHPDFGGAPDPDLSALVEFDLDPTQVNVSDASGPAPFLIYFLP